MVEYSALLTVFCMHDKSELLHVLLYGYIWQWLQISHAHLWLICYKVESVEWPE